MSWKRVCHTGVQDQQFGIDLLAVQDAMRGTVLVMNDGTATLWVTGQQLTHLRV